MSAMLAQAAEDAAGFWKHPLLVAAVPVILAAILSIGIALLRDTRRSARTLEAMSEFVLPHFRPAPPGQPDVSVPARLSALEEADERLRADLVRHMDEEISERKADRALRREEVQRIHDRIDGLGRRRRLR